MSAVVLISLMILTVATSDASKRKAEPEKKGDEAVGRFIEAVSPSFDATERTIRNPYPLSAEAILPARIDAWQFIAREADPKSPDMYLNFSLRVFQYSSAEEAARALHGLTIQAKGTGTLKSPLLAVLRNSSVVRLDGACAFSRDNWVAVQNQLLGALSPDDEAALTKILEIECGGSVVRTP